MILMLDNYDSFTHNLAQYCGELGREVVIVRNNEITIKEIADLNPESIIISPGPCSPAQAGISVEVIKAFTGKIAILGVCLGHQCIAYAYGGKVVHARKVMHGKTSAIFHSNEDLFEGLDRPFTATRYHSLIVEKNSLPPVLKITAWTQRGDDEMDEIMGLRHRTEKLYGVQFHPEAILTKQGHDLLANFFALAQTDSKHH